MPLYLMDSDHMTALFRGGKKRDILEARLKGIAPDDYGTSIISYEEQVRGWLDTLANAKKKVPKVFAYDELNAIRLLYERFAVWQYTPNADAVVETWIKNGVRIGTQDLRIAAIAVTNGATVLTENRRHFEKIPGVTFANWTTERES